MRKAADQWSAPTRGRGFRVRIPQSPSQAPVPAPFRQGGLWRSPGARSFDSLCSLRMTGQGPHPPQCAHWGTFPVRGEGLEGGRPMVGPYWKGAGRIVGATYGRLTERDQMEAAKGRPYDGTPLAPPARGGVAAACGGDGGIRASPPPSHGPGLPSRPPARHDPRKRRAGGSRRGPPLLVRSAGKARINTRGVPNGMPRVFMREGHV